MHQSQKKFYTEYPEYIILHVNNSELQNEAAKNKRSDKNAQKTNVFVLWIKLE